LRKQGVQALGNTAARDHENIRHGRRSILAAFGLLDGNVTARVEERHRTNSSRCSRIWMTHAYLATRPNQFKYELNVLTPTRGSCLNIAETLFGKMTRTFLRQIRWDRKKSQRNGILLGIAELKEMPAVQKHLSKR